MTSSTLPTPTPTPTPTRAEFRDLTFDESHAILERHNVGRIAYPINDGVDIQPIHYVFDDVWVYARTSRGHKFAALANNSLCAFEVDEVRGLFDWESVVIKGKFELLDPLLASQDAYSRGLELMRALVPDTFTDLDPAPHRSILFRIRTSDMTGRSSRSAS
jgi:nitroimidazol reductase NimA-like FMN-containing flavoprotein (pyridoxamine 5'-phosphate oxidase superfamily)